MVLDAKLLEENLKKIPEEENRIPKEREQLKILLLVLAGDQRTIRALSLEDIEKLFSESSSLLSCYREKLSYRFDETKLKNIMSTERRAV